MPARTSRTRAKPARPAPAPRAREWRPWRPEGGWGPVLLVAEVANAHEGDPERALALVEAAAKAGCDAVKFQKYYAEEMLAPGHAMMRTFASWEWGPGVWRKLFARAAKLGLKVFVDVFGLRALRSLAEAGPYDGLKVHGADIGNGPLLEEAGRAGCPVLVGTGGSSDLEIHRALKRLGCPERTVLLHGFQGFPTPLEDTALARVGHLREAFGAPVGLSDHLGADDDFAKVVPLLAVPQGICLIEKHLTLSRAKRGIDWQSALEPPEMAELAAWLRKAEVARGGTGLVKSALEEGYRKRFKKSLIAARDLEPGETVGPGDVALRMVEKPERHTLSIEEAAGRSAARRIPAGRALSGRDLGAQAGLCLVVRLKSTRLPRKALAEIHGRTAIERLLARARLCSAAAGVALCTSPLPEDAPLLDCARRSGLEAYAGDPDQPLERLIHCCERWGWQYAVRATGDNIFLDPELLAEAVGLALDQNLDYVYTRGAPVGTHCEVMSLSALKAVRDHARAEFTTEYLTWFLAGNPNFRCADYIVPKGLARPWRLTLDTPADLANIRDAVKLVGPGRDDYTLRELVGAVESDPELVGRILIREAPPAAPSVAFDFRPGGGR